VTIDQVHEMAEKKKDSLVVRTLLRVTLGVFGGLFLSMELYFAF